MVNRNLLGCVIICVVSLYVFDLVHSETVPSAVNPYVFCLVAVHALCIIKKK